MNNLSLLYLNQRESAKAESLYLETLELSRRHLEENHSQTLTTMCNLGHLYFRSGKLDRSIPLFEDALKRYEASLGPDHLETVLTMANLGVNYREAKRHKEAIDLLERAWQLIQKKPDWPASARGWIPSELAHTYTRVGEHAKAEPLFREALEQSRKLNAQEPLRMTDALDPLGRNLLRQKKYADAEPVLREFL